MKNFVQLILIRRQFDFESRWIKILFFLNFIGLQTIGQLNNSFLHGELTSCDTGILKLFFINALRNWVTIERFIGIDMNGRSDDLDEKLKKLFK
ncbi:hypothetical protein ACFOG5_09965 [Pedobacter fastidiosus]|uniref:Uncharacterized protein n=1 Tax=Pedobacter fastidiosus TaxID=2765361 RepID=A0ABR7KWE1_9SPHI|nr:hypothetical protein [Pedobacter fastidiosus]MBC6112437.1 hypothetical protein [Pedobacter fastidiosus]